eukprot:scaffold15973_cov120-Cylindrotheca_fusiformis.AAC.5
MRLKDVSVLDAIAACVHQAIVQTCGGGIQHPEEEQLRGIARKSISFPNNTSASDLGGKPHDIEVRAAVSLFHRWKRYSSKSSIRVVSDLGITRDVGTPRALAELWVPVLEESCREEGIAYDIRCQPSGIICVVTYERSECLRQAGKLPCPHCCHWCKGKKGLWWHQQQKHTIEHSEAMVVASSSINDYAIIPFTPSAISMLHRLGSEKAQKSGSDNQAIMYAIDPIEFVKGGNLDALKKAVSNGYVPSTIRDSRGASALHWAAGSGHLDIVRYLVEERGCDPDHGQQGKRSFSGRTALHWAARNGHLEIVQYLVRKHRVALEASTIDGTTAFCWAAWQGHLKIMDFLHSQGCNIHTVNKFGCNAVLWCAQGKGNATTLQWLATKGCSFALMNKNGHGVIHKAAQRGWKVGCIWYLENVIGSQTVNLALRQVGPDIEGYCPSDLAGMEGYESLARWLVNAELKLVERLCDVDSVPILKFPSWLTDPIGHLEISTRVSEEEHCTWERYGGLRRMRSKLLAFGRRVTILTRESIVRKRQEVCCLVITMDLGSVKSKTASSERNCLSPRF